MLHLYSSFVVVSERWIVSSNLIYWKIVFVEEKGSVGIDKKLNASRIHILRTQYTPKTRDMMNDIYFRLPLAPFSCSATCAFALNSCNLSWMTQYITSRRTVDKQYIFTRGKSPGKAARRWRSFDFWHKYPTFIQKTRKKKVVASQNYSCLFDYGDYGVASSGAESHAASFSEEQTHLSDTQHTHVCYELRVPTVHT